MKIESRGKYPGVKVHLDAEEAEMFLEFVSAKGEGGASKKDIIKFAEKLGNKIDKLLDENPDLLKERTEEQIQASMNHDLEKIEAQKAAMAKGKDWKKVKV